MTSPVSKVKRMTMTVAASAAISLICAGHSIAAENHGSRAETGVASAAHPAPAREIQGRIVAVRRVSRVITVQTPEGQVHQVSVPEGAKISTHDGSHFNSVRSGQSVRVSAVHDPSHGLVARSVSIP